MWLLACRNLLKYNQGTLSFRSTTTNRVAHLCVGWCLGVLELLLLLVVVVLLVVYGVGCCKKKKT